MEALHYWLRPRCWVCLGRGVVDGPLYTDVCPNPGCLHAERSERPASRWEQKP